MNVIRLARVLGADIPRTLVVGCEPQNIPGRMGGSDHPPQPDPYDDMLMELSKPVQRAVDEAVKLVVSVVEEDNAPSPNSYLIPETDS